MARKDKPSIGIVCGGPSAEAEVSRISAKGVAEALQAAYSHVHTFELTSSIGPSLRSSAVDVVFPVLHGPPGEDGTFQGFLEILGMPYVGSGVLASASAMDKVVAKQIFRAYGLPVARDLIVHRSEGKARAAEKVFAALDHDVVVKPSRQGSAVGVGFAREETELEDALDKAFAYDERLLVEQRITGKEITVGVLERNGIEALPVIEIRTPTGSWYDFSHRYTAGLSEHVLPAPLPKEQYERTQEIAKAAFACLGCRDLARVDFVVPERGEPVVLEINTMPGMTPTSLYPEAARAVGLSFEALASHLIERAWARGGRKSK